MTTRSKDEIQTSCLAELFRYQRAGAAVSMGVGKTRIGLRHIRNMYEFGARNFIVVAPKKAIFKSWKDEAALLSWDFLLEHITFTTYRSLHKLDKVFDAVYLDECHSLLPTHVPFLGKQTGRIIGLTGTPPRNESTAKYQIVRTFCPMVYSYITDDAVNENILNDYKIIIHPIKLDAMRNFRVDFNNGGSMVTSEKENYDYWTNRISEAEEANDKIMHHKAVIGRMSAMKKYPSKEEYLKSLLNDFDDKCLVFCNTQDQADRMAKHSYHSENSDSEKNLELFKNDQIAVLSCVNQLNEGINIPNLRYGVILHAYGNERQASQRIGRLLRLNPDEKAYIHILMFENTIDEHWVSQAVRDFDHSKIEYFQPVSHEY
jgi:superfamily II DNA or RNA helicase